MVTKTIDPAALNEVSTQITLRLLSGDGAALDSVDTSSEAYKTQSVSYTHRRVGGCVSSHSTRWKTGW